MNVLLLILNEETEALVLVSQQALVARMLPPLPLTEQ